MTMMSLLAAKPAGGGVFSPDDIANGVVWLDASDAGTITESGGVVSAWADKFNSYSFAEATNGPVTGSVTHNSLNVLDFETNDYLTYDAGSDAIDVSPYTAFVVMRYNSIRGTDVWGEPIAGRVSATGASTRWQIYRNNSDTISTDPGPGTGLAYTDDTMFIYEVRNDGSTTYHRINGGSESSASGAALSNLRYLRIGDGVDTTGNPPDVQATNDLLGRLAEIIIYNADLSAGDRDDVRTYLNDKWAVY